jgi:predicted metal-dependent phosphoesterase TrpH
MEIVPWVDAIEVYNSRCMLPSFNDLALDFAHRHNLVGTVGSDAHVAYELGRSVLLLEPFESPDELRKVVRDGVAQTRWSPPWFHLSSRYASFRKKTTGSSQNL